MQKTVSVIDLSAVRANALYIKSLLGGGKFYAVVKADAYGHGAVEISREIEDVVDGFCVAIVDEGAELRVAGITKPVLVLAPPLDGDDVARCSAYGLTVTVNSPDTARLIGTLDCHIKVNTGMNRYGCNPNELGDVLSALDKSRVSGVYTHIYAADNDAECRKQLALFKRCAAVVKAAAPHAFAHMSATAGIFKGGEYLFDGARCGIALYGYAPPGFSDKNLRPALRVYARRAQTTRPVGGGIGYNIADQRYERLSAYRLGYADGFARNYPLGEKTLCMDAFISRESAEYICVMDDAEKYAAKLGTISYEALCSVTRRSLKIYERRSPL